MRITVTIDDPTGNFQERLLALLAEYAGDVDVEQDPHWTIPRAESYYLSLPSRARRIVKEAAIRDGYVPAEELRGDENSSLRGHSAALKRALQRGVMLKRWPESIQPPIEPQGPGFGKVVGYRMPADLVQTFFTAIANTERSGRPVDPHNVNEATDSVQDLADTPQEPHQKERTTEK